MLRAVGKAHLELGFAATFFPSALSLLNAIGGCNTQLYKAPIGKKLKAGAPTGRGEIVAFGAIHPYIALIVFVRVLPYGVEKCIHGVFGFLTGIGRGRKEENKERKNCAIQHFFRLLGCETNKFSNFLLKFQAKKKIVLENEAIIEQLDLYARLLELHGENEFKTKAYYVAVFHLEKLTSPLAEMPLDSLKKLSGIGKSVAEKIHEINQKGSFEALDTLLAQTPPGLLSFFKIRGLGAKKIRTIWQELGISTLEALAEACEQNQIAQIKGFGEKTQESIKNGLIYLDLNADKLLYADADKLAAQALDFLKAHFPTCAVVGAIRRRIEVIETAQFLVATEQLAHFHDTLAQSPLWEANPKDTGLFAWRGKFVKSVLKVEVHAATPADYPNRLLLLSADEAHLSKGSKPLLPVLRKTQFLSEAAAYQAVGLPYIAPELREGLFEFEWAEAGKLPTKLIEPTDLKGLLHNHSTYSDGKDGLETMALACKALGYEYLGISDHSQSAVYANGLSEKRIVEQHAEIDALNQKLAPFKILKGIEADILGDGALDYPNEILQSFDFVVASVHSQLVMSKAKATARLIKAIENPYTTILGHPTGRLLLRREGYPLDMPKVLDACAANGVAIELNAHPVRLDLDWRWIYQALERGILLAINPDAHSKEGYQALYYGVQVARKGGLQPEQCLNALGLQDFETWLQQKNKKP